MKKFIYFGSSVCTALFSAIILPFYLAPSAHALEIGQQEVEITMTESYATRYIWRGIDLFSQDDGIFESSLDVTLPKFIWGTDIGINIWYGTPLTGGHVSSEELDYAFTASHDFESFNISIGHTYYDFPKANDDSDNHEVWMGASLFDLPYLPISVSFDIFAGYNFRSSSGGPEDGWYYSWGFATDQDLPSWEIFQKEQQLNLAVTFWGNDGVAGNEPSALYAIDFAVATDYAYQGFTITPSIQWVINNEDLINDDDYELLGRIDVSYSF